MNAIKEIEVVCPTCHVVLLAAPGEEGNLAKCPCGSYVQVPYAWSKEQNKEPKNWLDKFADWRRKREARINGGFNNARQDNAVRFSSIVFLVLLWILVNAFIGWANEPLARKMGYDLTATSGIVVEHPDGTATIEQIPVFETNNSYTDREARVLIWCLFLIFGFPFILLLIASFKTCRRWMENIESRITSLVLSPLFLIAILVVGFSIWLYKK